MPGVYRHHGKYYIGDLGQSEIRWKGRKSFQVEGTVRIIVKAFRRSDSQEKQKQFYHRL